MQTLKDHAIAVIANHNVMNFVEKLLSSIKDNEIEHKHIYFGDAGFLPEDRKIIEEYGLKVTYVRLPSGYTDDDIKTQSKAYRGIICHRVWFLKQIHQLGNNKIISLDADTAIISNDFSLLDTDSDITLTVREAGPNLHVLPIWEPDYPNCGVIFYNDMEKCMPFLDRWLWCQDSSEIAEHISTFEQWYFYHAMQYEEFEKLNCQRIHCRMYNCYDPDWVNEQTSIIHYKTWDAFHDTFETRVGRFESCVK